MMLRSPLLGLAGATLGLALLPVPPHADALTGEDCDACKPVLAHWDWKANGYELGPDADAAEAAATEAGRVTACDKSAPFLANRKLTCKPGCDVGELTERCQPREEPKCTSGTAENDAGMWMFVCRKTRQGKKGAPPCDDDLRKKQPGWGMCDVKVRAEKSRACRAPGCS